MYHRISDKHRDSTKSLQLKYVTFKGNVFRLNCMCSTPCRCSAFEVAALKHPLSAEGLDRTRGTGHAGHAGYIGHRARHDSRKSNINFSTKGKWKFLGDLFLIIPRCLPWSSFFSFGLDSPYLSTGGFTGIVTRNTNIYRRNPCQGSPEHPHVTQGSPEHVTRYTALTNSPKMS